MISSQIGFVLVLVNVSLFENHESINPNQGDQVSLVCRSVTLNPSRWLYIEREEAPQHVIANGKMIEPEYKGKITEFVDETTGEHGLLVHNVQLNESGWYVCIDDGTSLHVYPYSVNVHGTYIRCCFTTT